MDKRFALFVVALLGARLWAENLPELQEVVVTATREPTDLLQSPSFVTVVTQKDIEESGAADLSGVLAQQSGIVVNDYGPQGQGKTVSIRGSTTSQVLVLMDGVRLNSSFDGYVDLSRIPVDSIERVEIVHGGESSFWGTGAVGGVINIITKKAADHPELSLSVENGSYIPQNATTITSWPYGLAPVSSSTPASALSLLDNQKISLSGAARAGEVGLIGGATFLRAMNSFVWNDTADLGPWGAGSLRVRSNAQDLAQDAYAGADLPAFGGSLSARGTFNHSLIGVPGGAAQYNATPQDSQEDTVAMGSTSFRTDSFFSDRLDLNVKAAYRYTQEIYTDPAFQSIHATNAGTLDVTQKFSFSDLASAIYGVSGSYEAVNSTNLSGTDNRLTFAGFLSAPFYPAETLSITPAIRYDYYSDFPGFLAFQLGAVLKLSSVSSVHASAGSAYRVPTLSDLYWTDPFGDMGNPNLKPETSYSGEIGWSLQEQGISLEAAAFARLMYNQIEWVPNAQTFYATTQVINITESFLPGFELHGKIGLTEQFSFLADYTFIYSFLLQSPAGYSYSLADDQRVPWVPVHNLSVGIRYEDGLNTATVQAQYVSQKDFIYFDYTNLVWASSSLDGYVLLNAGYAIKASKSLTLSIRLLNILNTLYFTEQGGYPMPPFSIVTGMEVKL
ncbi:MAG: TonB-dependent receptor [Spirochaetia bacterium]|jgi:outer membrane cobalamin receptor